MKIKAYMLLSRNLNCLQIFSDWTIFWTIFFSILVLFYFHFVSDIFRNFYSAISLCYESRNLTFKMDLFHYDIWLQESFRSAITYLEKQLLNSCVSGLVISPKTDMRAFYLNGASTVVSLFPSPSRVHSFTYSPTHN